MEKRNQLRNQQNKNAENEGKKRAKEIAGLVVNTAAKTGKKGVKLASSMVVHTANGSKALAANIAQGAKELSDKTKIDNYNKRMKKYNPLFLEEYMSDDFFVPNLICIVDDAVRRDIDVCKGAIGWRENKRGTEVLFLYDEFVKDCGLTFVPSVNCDEVYYVDSHDRNRYIKLDCIFKQAHEEKIAELEHIAYSLGAKSCWIEIVESKVNHDNKKKSVSAKSKTATVKTDENASIEVSSDRYEKHAGRSEAVFTGNDNVIQPALKWFAHDGNIRNLIEYRSNGNNQIKSKTLVLNGSASVTMSKTAAYTIDAAVSAIGIGQNYALEDKSVKESEEKIKYHLEF